MRKSSFVSIVVLLCKRLVRFREEVVGVDDNDDDDDEAGDGDGDGGREEGEAKGIVFRHDLAKEYV